ncbi:MAG: GNAT family N-acetyltransferase [Prevotella sp.]|jgi:DNA-3-methyladenine glycosylase I|nr:GNAT family N-acetyltransferase [Prevotella sp.]
MKIRKGKIAEKDIIASLIMEAMDADCCQFLAGPKHSLQEFHQLISQLVAEEETLYSYQNALVAVDDEDQVIGACISYDGADFRRLRIPFIRQSENYFGMDHSTMKEETQAGELYVDSLCVTKRFRHHGVATALLKATIEKAYQLGIKKVGLLVDKGNPRAEKLYHSMGFQYAGETSWAGHPMKHLVKTVAESISSM